MELIKIGEKDERILLRDKNGNRAYFTFIDMLPLNGREYAALADENEDLFIMELMESTPASPERYLEITDDGEWEAVLQAFAKKNPEEFGD